MEKIKVIALIPFVFLDVSYASKDELMLEEDMAYTLARQNVVYFKNKKQFEQLDSHKKDIEAKEQEEQEEKNRQLTAIAQKEQLEEKRAAHQSSVDEITLILDDGQEYYGKYLDLVKPPPKKEEKE